MSLVSNGNGLYTATVATDVSGGQWDTAANGNMEGHLQDLILSTFAYAASGGANPLQNLGTNDSGVTIFIQFQSNISAADMTTLAGLVVRASEYFVVMNGATVLGGSTGVTLPADATTSTTLTFQRKNGDGTNSNGFGESWSFITSALLPVSKSSGTFNGSGQDTAVLGPADKRGTVAMTFMVGTMPQVQFNCTWS